MMPSKLQFYISDSRDVYYNLACEAYLTSHVGPDTVIIFLWRNDKCVVIGRNQNAYSECCLDAIRKDGVQIARRLSGGGAVYHDLGNLNFSFIAQKSAYSLECQYEIIAAAIKSFGLSCKKSGRNDLLIDGAKFSGNAYYKDGEHHCHHGTLLIKLDTKKISKYLQTNMRKLKSNGVSSHKSRVTNLQSKCSRINTETLSLALIEAASEVYLVNASASDILQDSVEIDKRRKHFASEDWIFGSKTNLKCLASNRFSWGEISVLIEAKANIIKNIKIESDMLLVDIAAKIEKCLLNVRLTSADISNALFGINAKTEDEKQIISDIFLTINSALEND